MNLLEMLEKKEENARKRENFLNVINNRSSGVLIAVVLCIAVFAIGMIHVLAGKTIYFWDSATYWDIARAIISGKLTEGGFLKSVWESIGTQDYNYIAALPSVLWMLIFGKSRAAFVSGLLVMYFVPSVILIYRLAVKLSKAPRAALLISVLIMPVTMFITFSGFVDIGGMMIGLACYNLYLTKDGICDRTGRYIAIGVLLVVIMVFRRYFAFFSVSFITMMIADSVLNRRNRIRLLIMLIVVAGLLIMVFRPFLFNILLKDYGSMYSGYKYSFGTDLKLITRYYGVLFLIAAVCTAVLCFVKKHEYRPMLVWLQIIACAAMFISTQTHGQQHLMLYAPAFTVLAIFMVNCVTKPWMLITICALTLFNTINPYIKHNQPSNIQDIKHYAFIPDFDMRINNREDSEEILSLRYALDEKIPFDSECGILSSSFVLNDGILRNVDASLNKKERRNGDYIKGLPEVDSRDKGRLDELYSIDYILVAIPSQTHLAPGKQTIVDEAVSSFVNYSDFAQLFVEEYDFDRVVGDIEVKLFRRTRDIDALRKKNFEDRLFYGE